MKVVSIVGARPQFIKAVMVSRALAAAGAGERILHTGQHYGHLMDQIFFHELKIPAPFQNLGIGSATHGAQTGRMLEAIEVALQADPPHWVLVYGDTNSTLAGALAAAKLHIPVAHVEAGLRSHNRRMPEEINRLVVDHISDLLFAPTDAAVHNLANEGIRGPAVEQVGDVMYDAALYFAHEAARRSSILERLALQPGGYVLVTIHRAENTDNSGRLRAIADALVAAAKHLPVVFPLHPRTARALDALHITEHLREHLQLSEPVGYLDMITLEKNARLIATDSGGVQKEAFFYKVPCITLRSETEWTELVDLGWNQLVPPEDSAAIHRALLARLGAAGREAAPYGDGNAAELIAAAVAQQS